ncbi:S-adenosyl-L-methionine-dependent methyltransferase [Dichotomocladium elegans]|nr:S-adenosyl-L-methionine-dependent methyltransferase [Dichotomocladium elegans]
MFQFAKSLLSSVFSLGKRPLDDDEAKDSDRDSSKRARVDAPVEEYTHRIKITSIPKDAKQLRKHLLEMGYKMTKAPKWNHGIINASSQKEAEEIAEKLNGYLYKNKPLQATYIREPKPDYTKRKEKKGKNKHVNDKNDTRTFAERLADQVTPLHKLPYDQQLVKKDRKNRDVMHKLKWKLAGLKDITPAAQKQMLWYKERKGLPCTFEPPIGSPELNGYRSKCEFTIGFDLEGNPTVGFLLGLYKMGVTAVLDPSECIHVSDTAKRIARAMQDYVRASEFPAYDRVQKTGTWRTLLTKTMRTGEVLVLVQMKTDDLTDEQVESEKQKLIEYWNSLKSQPEPVVVTTLLFQSWDGASNGITDRAPIEILTGDGFIHEKLLDCTFQISSNSFFQINTAATEVLYSKCAEWCNVGKGKKTTLLDLCCGTGTIGITMARSVDRVIGIEMVPEAIEDAKKNAELNGITNVEYYANKVEDKLHVIGAAQNEEVVAVLDPPRNGTHPSVIQAIRAAPLIKRVVYISCDSKQALANFESLCRPTSKKFEGSPFRPTRAVSIDLFPHTEHCELMVEFMRDELLDEFDAQQDDKEEDSPADAVGDSDDTDDVPANNTVEEE